MVFVFGEYTLDVKRRNYGRLAWFRRLSLRRSLCSSIS
jgi:hypothetical protein